MQTLYRLFAAVIFMTSVSCGKKGSPNGPDNDTTTPTVVSVDPAEGAVVPSSQKIKVTFSEEVNAATVNSATFIVIVNFSTDTIRGSITYANKVATFTPTDSLPFGTSIQVYVMNVADPVGNTMLNPYGWTFSTKVPTTPPQLLFSVPANGAVEVAQDAQIVLKFDRAMDQWSSHVRNYFDVEGYENPISIQDSGGCHVLLFNGWFEKNKQYTLIISGFIEDAWGNAIGTPITVTFTTKQSPTYWATLIPTVDKSRAFGIIESQNAYYVGVNYGSGFYCCDFSTIYRVDQGGNATLYGNTSDLAGGQGLVKSFDGNLVMWGTSTASGAVPFLAKFDQNGNVQWQTTYSAFGYNVFPTGVYPCDDNGFALTMVGNYGTISYLQKTNATGYVARQYNLTTSTGMIHVAGCVQTDNGNLIVVGSGANGIISAVIDAYGVLVSYQTFGGANDNAVRLFRTSDQHVLVAGNHFRSDGHEDYYLAKLNNTGSLIWERSFQQVGQGSEGHYFSLCESQNGDYLMTSDGAYNRQLLRVNSSGDEVYSMTVRFIVDQSNYFEDMIAVPDGFVLVGNSSGPIPGLYGYVVKLNDQGSL